MKHVLLLCCLLSGVLNAQTLPELRQELFYTDFDLEKSKGYFNQLNSIASIDPSIIAYKAAAEALIAKHSWNPVVKINNLKSAQRNLKLAIEADSTNLEIRFIRFYIERSTPKYLGYSKNMEEDVQVMVTQIENLSPKSFDKTIAVYIHQYMTECNAMTDRELATLSKNLGLL